MIVEFFNTHPEGERFVQEALDAWLGMEVQITRDGEAIGTGTIIGATVNDEGVLITYSTEAPMGLSIVVPEPPGWYTPMNGDTSEL